MSAVLEARGSHDFGLRSATLLQRLAVGPGTTVFLMALLLMVVAWPIQSARWVENMPPLSLMSLGAVALVTAGTGLGWSWRLSLGLGAVVGVLLVAVSVVGMTPGGGIGDRIETLSDELVFWFEALGTDSIRGGAIEFVAFILAVFWGLGYFGGWLALRRRQGWPTVVGGGLVLSMALANLAVNSTFYLVMFVALSALLLLHLSSLRRQHGWQGRGLVYDRAIGLSHAGFILGFGLVVVAMISVVPALPWTPLGAVGERLESGINTLESEFGRLFSGLPSRADYRTITFGDETFFSGNPNLTADVLFTVGGTSSQYWRARTYSTYTSTGWTTSDASFASLEEFPVGPEMQRRREVSHSFSVDASTDTLFSGGEPRGHTMPSEGLSRSDAPWDVMQVRFSEGRQFFPRRRDLAYTATASVSTAAPNTLRSAGTDYPAWVTDTYLRLPDTLPGRVRGLAQGIASEPGNPYDKAIALRDFLLNYAYNLDITAPPKDRDGVDFFLFDSQQGYCDYYASSLVVMLRTVGIPARYALGYAPGLFDGDRQTFHVRELNYHSWAEVYFPGYGWVTVEATPANALEFGGGGAEPDLPSFPPGTGFGEEDFLDDETGSGDVPEPVGGAQGPVATPMVILGLAGLVVLLVGLAWYRWWWRLRALDLPSEIYAKMRRLATAAGMPPLASQTPREYGRYLAERMPERATAVTDIAEVYAFSRYGPRFLSLPDMQAIDYAWSSLRWALLRRLFRSRGGA